jgi:hypothetical protein
MFPTYGRKLLSRKAVDNWVEKCGKRFADDEEIETEVAETTVKKFYAAGFDTLVKRRDKCISVGGVYVEKYIIFLPGLNITRFTFYIHLWPIY